MLQLVGGTETARVQEHVAGPCAESKLCSLRVPDCDTRTYDFLPFQTNFLIKFIRYYPSFFLHTALYRPETRDFCASRASLCPHYPNWHRAASGHTPRPPIKEGSLMLERLQYQRRSRDFGFWIFPSFSCHGSHIHWQMLCDTL